MYTKMYAFLIKIYVAITVMQILNFIILKHILLSYYNNKFITVVLYLLTENVNTGHKHTTKQNNKLPKLPELYVILQRIDQAKEETIKIDKSLRKRRKIRI